MCWAPRMAMPTDFVPIEFLVDRKFGSAARRRAETNSQLANELATYRAQLRSLSNPDFQALLDSERATYTAERAAIAQREEEDRFFNQPYSRADFEHWNRAAHRTLDEAVALSFGRAPERVNSASVERSVRFSAFASEYQRRRDLAQRALARERLFDPVLPGIFIAWLKRISLSFPSELEAAVTAGAFRSRT